MKQGLSFLMTLLLLQVCAQDSPDIRKRIFKVKVLTVSGHRLTGYLNKITDTTLILSDQKLYYNPYRVANNDLTSPIGFSNITTVQIKRKGAATRGLLIGALVGATTGAITGLIMGDDEGLNEPNNWCILCTTGGEKAVIGVTAGGVLGGLTGLLIGALAHQKFLIGRQKKEFDKMRLTMLERIGRVPLE